MDSEGVIDAQTGLNLVGTENLRSLGKCRTPSQTNKMGSGGVLDAETGLNLIGTGDPGSLRV